uniref:chaperone protein dnaJ 20, chloroplastic-like n=1 Tax=Erigeron canadensis TaxID=72917 RepID=UPI001CB962EA|nr:chaperone protein dnaJ 20, chloroplastic-like [Erigeron canadensis]
MASISLCFGSSPCVKPLIFAYRSSYASYDTRSHSGSESVSVSKGNNFYEILSLSSNKVGTQEIKRAYRSLALKYHPDVSHDQDTTKMFILLQTAYKTLVDPVSREEYDCALGYGEPGHLCATSSSFGDHVEERRRWEGQIIELRRRSNFRSEHREGSWGSRVRYANGQSGEPN